VQLCSLFKNNAELFCAFEIRIYCIFKNRVCTSQETHCVPVIKTGVKVMRGNYVCFTVRIIRSITLCGLIAEFCNVYHCDRRFNVRVGTCWSSYRVKDSLQLNGPPLFASPFSSLCLGYISWRQRVHWNDPAKSSRNGEVLSKPTFGCHWLNHPRN
jgi:hypothetical protein